MTSLDQLISFCGNDIAEADVLSMFGLTARASLLALTRAVLAGEVDTALRELNDLAKNGKDLGRLVTDLLNHFRNLLIFQVSKGDLKLLEVSEAEAAALPATDRYALEFGWPAGSKNGDVAAGPASPSTPRYPLEFGPHVPNDPTAESLPGFALPRLTLPTGLDPDTIAAFGKRATGEKYLVMPQR